MAKAAEAVEATIAGEGKLDAHKLRADSPSSEHRFHGKPRGFQACPPVIVALWTETPSRDMRELRREIDIDAPPAAVWAVLTDIRSYSEWNPFMPHLAGELREGAKLEVRIEPPGGRAMTFKPTVLAVEPDRELRWRGRLLVPGIFDGEHILHIEPLDQARSRFTQAERFSGLLVGLFGSTLDKTELGFVEMNAALKARAERR